MVSGVEPDTKFLCWIGCMDLRRPEPSRYTLLTHSIKVGTINFNFQIKNFMTHQLLLYLDQSETIFCAR